MMSGGGLSKLAIALTVIFVISLVALFTELFYVLWRRRHVFRSKFPASSDGECQLTDHYSTSDSCFSSVPDSKKLLNFFFCVRSQSRVEPNSVTPASTNSLNLNASPEMEDAHIDILKLQRMCGGPPRFLFTIKEEEKEDLESLAEKSPFSSAEKESIKRDGNNKKERVSLKDCFKVEEELLKPAAAAAEFNDYGGVGGDVTPFSTPCASPVYFTPATSPIDDAGEAKTTSLIAQRGGH